MKAMRLKPTRLKKESVALRWIPFTRVKNKRRVIRAEASLSRNCTKREVQLQLRGYEDSIKHTPDRVKLFVGPREARPCARDLSQAPTCDMLIEQVHSGPINPVIVLVMSRPDEVEIPTHDDGGIRAVHLIGDLL
jgi:hypothetical protein